MGRWLCRAMRRLSTWTPSIFLLRRISALNSLRCQGRELQQCISLTKQHTGVVHTCVQGGRLAPSQTIKLHAYAGCVHKRARTLPRRNGNATDQPSRQFYPTFRTDTGNARTMYLLATGAQNVAVNSLALTSTNLTSS